MDRATVDQLLGEARAAGIERLDAQRLLTHRLGQTRSWLIAHGDEVLAAVQVADVRAAWLRLADGEPLAHLTGEAGFHGLTLHVNADVLVPRADTEVLVDWALEVLAGGPAEVLDLGTGSGAIALALAHACPAARLTAIDASPQALAVARANGGRLGLRVEWLESDWWSALGTRGFDLIVSNPPYIAGGDPHLPALRHEPTMALTPGGDGLDAIRQIAAAAPAHLRPGAWLLLEHGHDQADDVQRLLRDAGFGEVATRPDRARRPRCTGGRWAGELGAATATFATVP